ncbi:hypothetical protein WICMUC_002948 [Wickerhamomyces mucosus]|uniref:Iron-sulfur assembly protein 1 n=1 Tax=Wickerhamomyces mucosus TaxID=1378264 RepID=A0A9P8TCZ5_9ASCO|nr:hypothetical protein WICMUC_002948 [Wickerhamomyces mucosus]
MLRTKIPSVNFNCSILLRTVSTSSSSSKRFLQTGHTEASNSNSGLPYKLESDHIQQIQAQTTQTSTNTWARHKLSSRSFQDLIKGSKTKKIEGQATVFPSSTESQDKQELESKQENKTSASTLPAKKKSRRTLRPRKALIRLSPNATAHLKALLDQPEPKLIRIGVKNRGCSGLTYNLEYINEPNKFDEVVEQDGVKVIIDSKALFSIVGSEMDWLDDKLSSRFIFRNPNSKGTCGCGESFMV